MSLRMLSVCLLALSVGQSASAQTPAPKTPIGKKAGDVAMRTTYTSGAHVSANRTYFKGPRERFDFPGVSVITQCDRNRSLQLNAATRRFLVVSSKPPAARPASGGTDAPQMPAEGGVISETTTLSDTGERKTMFGLEARHIKTVTVRQPDSKACEPEKYDRDRWMVRRPAGPCRVSGRAGAARVRRLGRSGLYRSHREEAGRRREAGVRPQHHGDDDRGRRQGRQDPGHGSHRPSGGSSRRSAIRRAGGLYRGPEPERTPPGFGQR